jgi:hypothetical protein
MGTKHTPTPWRVVNGSLIKDELMPFDRDERYTALIATTGGHATGALADANAAFIVRAVNSHEHLVAALRNLVTASEAYSTVHAPDSDDITRMLKYADAFDKARAVLAAMEAA